MNTEWRSTTKYIVGIGLFLFALGVIYISRSVLAMLVVASLIALLVRPLITWLDVRFRFPHGAAVLVSYLLVAIVIILAPLILLPPIIDAVNFLFGLDYEALIANSMQWTENSLLGLKDTSLQFLGFSVVLDPVVDPILNAVGDADLIVTPELPSLAAIIPSVGQAFALSYGMAVDVLGTVFSGFVGFLFLIISSIYLSIDGDRFIKGFIEAVPEAFQSEIRTLIKRLREIWDAFFRGQVTLMVIIGSVVWLGLTILGVPGAFALGIIAGLLEIIPNLGPLLAAIPAVIVALLQGSDHFAINNFVFALIVIGFYIFINFLENTLVVPRVMGDSVKLHPLVVILGVLVGASVWGILGALLAAPVIASGREITRYLYSHVVGEEPFQHLDQSTPEPDISLRESFEEIKEKAGKLLSLESDPAGEELEQPNESLKEEAERQQIDIED
jgi:predicted PurR-regulated permease PerM